MGTACRLDILHISAKVFKNPSSNIGIIERTLISDILTDRHTDRRTDKQTERQTELITKQLSYELW